MRGIPPGRARGRQGLVPVLGVTPLTDLIFTTSPRAVEVVVGKRKLPSLDATEKDLYF